MTELDSACSYLANLAGGVSYGLAVGVLGNLYAFEALVDISVCSAALHAYISVPDRS